MSDTLPNGMHKNPCILCRWFKPHSSGKIDIAQCSHPKIDTTGIIIGYSPLDNSPIYKNAPGKTQIVWCSILRGNKSSKDEEYCESTGNWFEPKIIASPVLPNTNNSTAKSILDWFKRK